MSTEAKKASKFQKGLCADIHHAFREVQSGDYAIVVHYAYAIKRDQNEWRMTQAAKKRGGTSQGSSSNKKRKWIAGPKNNIASKPQCNQCGRKHGTVPSKANRILPVWPRRA